MARPSLGEPGSAEAQRRIADALSALDARKEARGFTVSADFGSTPATTASAPITGLTWLTDGHQIVFGLRTPADATAGLRACASEIKPGTGFLLTLVSTSALTGVKTLSCIAA